jgi:hypothetical protein
MHWKTRYHNNEITKLLDKLLCRQTEISYNCCERSAARTRKRRACKHWKEDFYDTCTEYVQKLCLPFLMPIQRMDWINLKEKVTWKGVQINCVFMKMTCLVGSHVYKSTVTANWKCGMKKMTKMLWEVVWNVGSFTEQNINAVNMKCLISFYLALPESNTQIECVFSITNVLWSDEKKNDFK